MGEKDFGPWVCSKLGSLCILSKSLPSWGFSQQQQECWNKSEELFQPSIAVPPKPTGQAALGSPGAQQAG